MKDNILYKKAEKFALRIIRFCNILKEKKKEFIISNQLFRSGTSIGANIAESLYAASKLDFANKLQIALKEASESEYWINLLYSAEYVNKIVYDSLIIDLKEIIRILTSSINTSKGNCNQDYI